MRATGVGRSQWLLATVLAALVVAAGVVFSLMREPGTAARRPAAEPIGLSDAEVQSGRKELAVTANRESPPGHGSAGGSEQAGPPNPTAETTEDHAGVSDPSKWASEFEGKSTEELRMAEQAIRSELAAELKLEAERRFARGQYDVYAQGELPSDQFFFGGATFSRGDEQSVKIVNLDRRIDFDLFARERKADWLRERILSQSKRD